MLQAAIKKYNCRYMMGLVKLNCKLCVCVIAKSPTWQIHAGKCFWRPGEEHAAGFLIPALESTPHLLAHLAATPEVYKWDVLLLVN